jgi:hypothetical protein
MKSIYTSAVIKRVLVALLIIGALVTSLILANRWQKDNLAPQPKIGLMTTLPLRWGEGDIASMIDVARQPAAIYQRLDADYEIRLIDVFDAVQLKGLRVLLLAQPRAFTPAEFVALENWVIAGGHLVILADPALQWESIYPIGDKRRPLFTTMLSPLFKHWGLELVMPVDQQQKARGAVIAEGMTVQVAAPGAWMPFGTSPTAKCSIAAGSILADCKVGQGRAWLFADADLLNDSLWAGTGVRALAGEDDFQNVAFIQKLLINSRN